MEELKSFISGWAGGVGLLLVGHPFDTIKTRLQADQKGMYKGALDCLRQTTSKEGVMAVYKGVTAPLTGVGLVFAIYFLSYDSAEKFLRKIKGDELARPLKLQEVMICGGFTGVVGTCVLAPSELIKVQQQTAVLNGTSANMSSVLSNIYRNHGIRGFFRGFGATLMRDVPGSMAWFGAYELAKRNLCEDPSKPSVSAALIAGGCGGMGMWVTALPMDTIKTRIQASQGKNIKVTHVIRSIFSEGGIAAFYKGFAPILLRAFPANAACFACREKCQTSLNDMF